MAAKNAGQPPSCGVGNPINPATGNKWQEETDYLSDGRYPLRLTRTYNSTPTLRSGLGAQWLSAFERKLVAYSQQGYIVAARPNGRIFTFSLVGATWTPDADVKDSLVRLTDASSETTGWRYTDGATDEVETYDASGKLIAIASRGLTQALSYDSEGFLKTVTDPFGRELRFTYNTKGFVETMIDPAGGVYHYSYDTKNNLVSVSYPDATPSDDSDNPKRLYHYEDPRFPYSLTGITDENGNRVATYAYDDKGRAILSEHAGGAERVTLTYHGDGTTTVTDAQGASRTYTFEAYQGIVKVKSIQGGACPTCPAQSQFNTYDANGNVVSKTDFNGIVTKHTYDLTRNLEISRTETVGKPEQRTTTTQWHAEFRLPVQIDVFDRNNTHLKRTTFTYDTVGRVLAQTEIDSASGESRTTTHSYNAMGLLASVDGPRTDVADITRFEYDAQGNLITSTNALGHETRISAHDAHGRPLTLQDPNGLVTQLAYDARGRLKSRTVDGQVTLFSYDATGNLSGIMLPNGMSLAYTYDAAYRLTAIQDRAGNTITYTLDPLGNRIKEEVTDPAGALTRTHARVYNSLNRLHTTPKGVRLTVKLALNTDTPTGILTLTRPPRKARYTLNQTTGSGVYGGLEEKSGKTVRLTINEDTRSLTLLEEDQPPRTLTVDPEHWHLNHTKGAKHLRFAAEAAGLTLKGALRLGKDGRVAGHLKLREGERQKSHALTARPTPSGPAGLFYIHTDHLGTPQILTDETQQVVWVADYQPFGQATLTKESVTFNLRFPGQRQPRIEIEMPPNAQPRAR